MRTFAPCLVTVAITFLPVLAHGEDAAASGMATVADMPYSSIVARNMFGLLPIPKVDPRDNEPPPDPPPKITPTGIMTIFGRDQALFKVANKPKPGQPAKEDAYVLAEGERQDDIEVVRINHVDGVITFNNHGTTQELDLVPVKEGSAPPSGPGEGRPGPGMFRPGVPMPGANPFQHRMGMTPASFGQGSPSVGNNAANSGAGSSSGSTAGLSFGSEVNERGIYQPAADPNPMTPEQSAILMEAQRNQYLQGGNSRLANMIPPTKYTDQLNPSGQGSQR